MAHDWRVGDLAVFDDPTYGKRSGRISAVHPEGGVEFAVFVPGDSRSVVYTVEPWCELLQPEA